MKVSRSSANNNKLKQAIIISTVLHLIIFTALIWSPLDEHINIKQGNISSINAVLIDTNTLAKKYHYHKQQPGSLAIAKKQREKNLQEVEKKQTEQKKNIKKTVKHIIENKKNTENTVKNVIPDKQQKDKKVFKKKTNNTDDINNLFKNLSSEKDAPQTIAKKNNLPLQARNIDTNSQDDLSTDIKNYVAQIKSAIESHFYDASSYAGKTCTLRVKLAQNGNLLNIQSEEGDPALCSAALIAARQAVIPKPPSKFVYEILKNMPIDFKP